MAGLIDIALRCRHLKKSPQGFDLAGFLFVEARERRVDVIA